VACLASVLSAVSIKGGARRLSISEATAFLPEGAAESKSVWTVDLAYGLKAYGIKDFFCTTTNNGVDPTHAELGFYSKDFAEDENRVNVLINTAAENGILIEEESVGTDELVRWLSIPGNMVIALVNSVDLRCDSCSGFFGFRMLSCMARYLYGGYVGHYVLLQGHLSSGHFVYHDPGQTHTGCKITYGEFERARKARGTDEDLVFVSTSTALPDVKQYFQESRDQPRDEGVLS